MTYKPAPITKTEAENSNWWDDYLTARMVVIQSMVALGKEEDTIIAQVTCDSDHARRLLGTAKYRQEREW